MKRKAIDQLIKWKEANSRIPILLTGAKGVGKTYLAYDFAKAFFEHICYINFEREPYPKQLFTALGNDQPEKLLLEYFKLKPEYAAESRILILDEVNCCTDALELINFSHFVELFGYIIIISSEPVPEKYRNKLSVLPIYPMEFDEFLRATGNEWYIELIATHFNSNIKIPDIVHKELLALHQLYLKIGGMPGSINEYLSLSSTVNVSEQHSFLIGSYHDNILKNNSDSDALKMNQVFDSLLLQLMKDNRKFQYNIIRKGTTHSIYQDAIVRLTDIGYVILCSRINSEQLTSPDEIFGQGGLSDHVNSNFKLYLPDTGLLNSLMIKEYGSDLLPCSRKALLENYVAQALQAKHYPFAFWESGSMAKIDFIISKDSYFLPIEVHDSDNTRSKSISILKQKCSFPYAVKISSKNFEFSSEIKYVPYYAVFCL